MATKAASSFPAESKEADMFRYTSGVVDALSHLPSLSQFSHSEFTMTTKWAAYVLVSASFCLFAGCSTLGPKTIPSDRFNYNQAAAESSNQQLLLNIVRLRYGEPVHWLEIGSMLSQYTFQAGADITSWTYDINRWENPTLRAIFGVRPDPAPTDSWGANVQWSDRPTITYTPVQGEEFAKRVMTPIPATTVMYLAQSGWNIDQVLQCCVQRINDVDNKPIHDITAGSWGSTKKFQSAARLMRRLQDAGQLHFSLEYDIDQQATYLYWAKELEASHEGIAELSDILELSTDSHRFRIIERGLRTHSNELALETRSLLGTMYALSQSVDPPIEHVRSGEIQLPYTVEGETNQDSWLQVKHSRTPVANAVSQIYYRGYWFYVPRTDWSSKRTFALLTYLFSLQASGAAGTAPMVTVQAGGG